MENSSLKNGWKNGHLKKSVAGKLVSEIIIIKNQKTSGKYGNGKVGVKNFNSEIGWKKLAPVKNIIAEKLNWKILSQKIVEKMQLGETFF